MSTNNDVQFDELKKLLLNENEQRIDKIETRLTKRQARVNDTADVFVDAVDKAISDAPDAVEDVLAAPIKNQFRRVAEDETDWLAETLTPAFMPMMRKLIASSIESAFDKINNLISGQASIGNRIKWRIKSLFSGMSVSEIALNQSIEYRVDEAYLLNSETGLLIDHVTREDTQRDPDGVSAMLVALQDFVRDTFAKDELQPIQQVRLGKRLVNFIYQGKTSLAYVAQGVVSDEAKENIVDILASLIAKGDDSIATFDGSSLHQSVAHPYMEEILSLEQQKSTKVAKQWPAFLVVSILSIVGIAFTGYKFWQNSYYQGCVDTLSSAPGWNVLSVEKRSSSFEDWRGGMDIKALKDDAASSYGSVYKLPKMLLGTIGVDSEAFVSKNPVLLQKRFERFDVAIKWKDEQFVISEGTEKNRESVKTLIDFYGFNYSDITVVKKAAPIKVAPIESLTIYFEIGAPALASESETLLQSKFKDVVAYCADVKKHSKKSCEALIEVFSDSGGTAEYNKTLRFQRFSALQSKMARMLKRTGIKFAYKDGGTLERLAIISFGEI